MKRKSETQTKVNVQKDRRKMQTGMSINTHTNEYTYNNTYVKKNIKESINTRTQNYTHKHVYQP